MENGLSFRIAVEDDVGIIMRFITELAEYEKIEHEVTATESSLRLWLFERKTAEVIIASFDGEDIGFALFYRNFSTVLGKAGMHLEDLYIRREYRGMGYGKALFARVADVALERDCGRLEWCCLDWNEPSIKFYLSVGAQKMDEWTTYRLSGENLKRIAEHAQQNNK